MRTATSLQHLLRPYDSAAWRRIPISTLVNSPRNESPDCIRPLAAAVRGWPSHKPSWIAVTTPCIVHAHGRSCTMPPLQRLGPYLIQQPLGSGGMGTVFLGVDETTGERAAVKVLSPALGADANFRERFGTEIETLKKLQHPNIVQLLGFGEQDGQLFYAMEMVDGQSLQQELHGGPAL